MRKFGWWTDEKSRDVALNEFAKSVRLKELNEVDNRELTELHSFIWVHKTSRRRPEAEEGAHDDTVMADAICWQMINTPPIIQRGKHVTISSQNYS